MEKTFKAQVAQEKVTYLESLDYERTARENIIMRMLEMGDKESIEETQAFKNYQKEYFEQFTAFEVAKAEIEKEYIPKEWLGHQIDWSLDYSTCEITFTKKCEC